MSIRFIKEVDIEEDEMEALLCPEYHEREFENVKDKYDLTDIDLLIMIQEYLKCNEQVIQ